VAGEQTEVVVLRTFDEAGAAHDTKMWVVDHEGAPWVRVANPERAWYQRLRARPRATLLRAGATIEVDATTDGSPGTRQLVDQAFARKYGLTDRWYGILLRRGSIPIRLDPVTRLP
jgi:hypothetical protein